MMNNQKVGLIILDGWGIGDRSNADAIFNSRTPVMDSLLEKYPHSILTASGEAVGLPGGQMGNSEVGHLNIGAGRVVYQELTRINKSIREGAFFQNPVLVECFDKAKKNGTKVHFIGLVSNGGVHSSQDHLHALLDMAKSYDLKNVWVHAFTDGRDCDPKSGLDFIEKLEDHMKLSTGKIATIVGRYYAMDRDNRWERIQVAYDAMVKGIGTHFFHAAKSIEASYEDDITDEFIQPLIINTGEGRIQDGDTVVCFNFRTDRPREISQVLTQQAFHEFGMHPLRIDYYTMTRYDAKFKNVHAIFEKDNLHNTLGEILSKMDRTQVRIAETEKYPHVTFFFNGGREQEFKGESRILVKSPKVATYDLQPEMSAPEVKERILEKLRTDEPDFFCLNFANPDMVGHTGVYEAIVKAVETVDSCLGEIVDLCSDLNYELIIIADHGNADVAFNSDGSPNTAHSLNPVPVILVTKQEDLRLNSGILADVAPTILDRMRIAAPLEMTGKTLVTLNH
jgi:2,3-bisphosphoglycerate-independent phosphoglycerate mutase